MKPMVNTIQPSASNDLVSQASMPKTTAATMNRIRASRVIGFSFGWTSVVGDYKRDNRGSEAPEGTQSVEPFFRRDLRLIHSFFRRLEGRGDRLVAVKKPLVHVLLQHLGSPDVR